MKGRGILKSGVLGLCLIWFATIGNPVAVPASEENFSGHEKVSEPTKALMNTMSNHVDNILHGLLTGNFKYVGQEASAMVNESYKINETFFPAYPKENSWFKRAKVNPDDTERIIKLKDEFDLYLKEITSSALEVQKAAQSNDEQLTFKSFTRMIDSTCFDCHKRIRDPQVPIENR